MHHASRFLLLLAGLASAAPRAPAQPTEQYGVLTPERSISADARLTIANAALGAATSGLYRWIRRQPVRPALVGGALGGAVAYGGKRLVVERFPGAGLAGRQLGSIGHAMIRNASDGQPLLGRLVLPFGPVRFYVRPEPGVKLRARVDVPTMVYALAIGANGSALDLGATLSSGALVFESSRAPLSDLRGYCLAGLAFGGLVLMNDLSGRGTDDRNPSFAHERVHVSQYDQLFLTASDPLEQWVASRVPGGRAIKRYADFNLLAPALLLPTLVTTWEQRPWEQEAIRVTRQTFGDARRASDDASYASCRSTDEASDLSPRRGPASILERGGKGAAARLHGGGR